MGIASRQLAFLFPGQGSQAVGMLNDFAVHHPEVEETFAIASRVLGMDLWSLVTQGPEDELNQTQFTQPAMLAAGVAVWKVWSKSSPVRPGWAAGHSLGEYTALVCAEALAFEDAVRLVAERGRLMQQAVPRGEGAMAAILGLGDEEVAHLCAAVSTPTGFVTAANINAPGQVVIAGHSAAVDQAVAVAKSEGARRAVVLPVSVPSHCRLMEQAAARLSAALAATTFCQPAIPVIHNVDVAPHDSPESIREVLAQQMFNAVRWSETIRFLHGQGVTHFVECGPGKVLGGLNKRIAPGSLSHSLSDQDALVKTLELVS